MPTYQYACTACGERLEAVQSFTDSALTECPACSGALRKVFSAVGVVFKGSGFYKNDSRPANGNGSGGEKKSEPAKAGAAAKGDTGGTGGDKASSGASADAGRASGTSGRSDSGRGRSGGSSSSGTGSGSTPASTPAAKSA